MFVYICRIGYLYREKVAIMIGKSPKKEQRDLFRPLLEDFIDMNHELVLLANKIDRSYFEKELGVYYTAKEHRVFHTDDGWLHIAKTFVQFGDERLPEYWVGMFTFSIFADVYFLNMSFHLIRAILSIFANESEKRGWERFLLTVWRYTGKKSGRNQNGYYQIQPFEQNNTTFPTDAKLCKKVIDKCNKIAEEEKIDQRRRYRRESKQLLRDTYNGTHPKRAGKAKKAKKRLKTIANTQIRELERKMNEEQKRRDDTKRSRNYTNGQ